MVNSNLNNSSSKRASVRKRFLDIKKKIFKIKKKEDELEAEVKKKIDEAKAKKLLLEIKEDNTNDQ